MSILTSTIHFFFSFYILVSMEELEYLAMNWFFWKKKVVNVLDLERSFKRTLGLFSGFLQKESLKMSFFTKKP